MNESKVESRRSNAAIALLAFACVACASAEAQKFSHRDIGFTIQAPATWDKKEKLGDTAIAFVAQKTEGKELFRASANVVAQEIPSDADMEKFAASSLAVMNKLLKDYKEVRPSESITIGKLKAVRITYRYTFEDVEQNDVRDLKAILILTVAGKYGYAITCTAEATAFELHEKEFDDIVKSFAP